MGPKRIGACLKRGASWHQREIIYGAFPNSATDRKHTCWVPGLRCETDDGPSAYNLQR